MSEARAAVLIDPRIGTSPPEVRTSPRMRPVAAASTTARWRYRREAHARTGLGGGPHPSRRSASWSRIWDMIAGTSSGTGGATSNRAASRSRQASVSNRRHTSHPSRCFSASGASVPPSSMAALMASWTRSCLTGGLLVGKRGHEGGPGPVHPALDRADPHPQDHRRLLVAVAEHLDHHERLAQRFGQPADGVVHPGPLLRAGARSEPL